MAEVMTKREHRRKVLRLPKKRAWKAAKSSLTTANWIREGYSIDWDLRQELDVLRTRSRAEAQNNDHVRHFLRLVKTNVVGPQGIILQGRVKRRSGRADDRANDAIEESWKRWGKRGVADVTGTKSWKTLQRECIETVARDGEAVYHKVVGWENGYGFALQQLDPSLLDTQMNERRGENEVVMGVELDPFRRPVAFYFLEDRRNIYQRSGDTKRRRIPAEDIIHVYLPEWVLQTRGVPWVATALLRLHQLEGYEEAEVTAARVGATKMGFYTQSETAGSYVGDDEDARGNPVQDARPAEFEILPEGWGFESWDPQHPNSAFGDFTKSVLRSVASGLGVNYNTLANDLEGVNYSSLRHGSLTERDVWMLLQDWFIESWNDRVYHDWLEPAMLSDAVMTSTGETIPYSRIDDLRRVSWQPRRWPWVDPYKEVQANKESYFLRTRSISDIIREQGRDPEETFAEIARETAALEALGITPPSSGTNAPGEVSPDGNPE